MKRLLMIGAIGAGKSSLTKALLQDHKAVSKTQSLEFRDWIIDTPGEYSENPLLYRALMATSMESNLLLVVHDATQAEYSFPPGFTLSFQIPTIGVLTKVDHPLAEVATAERLLRMALPSGEIWHTSAVTLVGIDDLRNRLLEILNLNKS